MTTQEAREFIRAAIPGGHGTPALVAPWVDLGAGSGTFTFALAELLGPGGTVVAVEREAAALESLARGMEAREDRAALGLAGEPSAPISLVHGDFRLPGTLNGLPEGPLGGVLAANALHFDGSPGETLAAWAERMQPGGRVVVVEYDDRPPNPWVPYILGAEALGALASEWGFGTPTVVGERPSSYGGILYCAWMEVA